MVSRSSPPGIVLGAGFVTSLRHSTSPFGLQDDNPSHPQHLPLNTFSSTIVISTLQIAQALLQDAALSFLAWAHHIPRGIGARPRSRLVSVAWPLASFPWLAILSAVIAINRVGHRAFDPRVG